MDEQQFNEYLLADENGAQAPNKAEQKKINRRINDQNNTQAINTALVVGSKFNPYMAAAKKVNDYSGGRLAKAAGKITTVANKVVPGGRLAQSATNNGTAQRIGQAVSKKKGQNSLPQNNSVKSNNSSFNKSLNNASKEEAKDYASDGGGQNLKVDTKVLKWGLISVIAVFPLIIFVVLLTSASSIIKVAYGFSKADSLSILDEEKINNTIGKPQKIEDEINVEDNTSAYDYFIKSSFRDSKLAQANYSKTALYKRKKKDITLDDLEDVFPNIKNLSGEYDSKLVYDFFLKMYNLYKYYKENYPTLSTDEHPILDLPLLLATLYIQSDDFGVVFESNLEPEDRLEYERTQPVKEYSYTYDWSNYVFSKDSSTHDMEILAQHMVSKQVKEFCRDSNGKITNTNILKDSQIGTKVLTCKEGETYYTGEAYYSFDNEKYKEFLKEFIEKKYYLNYVPENSQGTNPSDSTQNQSGNYVSKNDNGDWRKWKQCGMSWSNKVIPNSTPDDTMCKSGCLITAVSMQIARSGTLTIFDNIDPGIAVDNFKFASGGNLYWKSVSNLAPYFEYYTSGKLVGLSKTDVIKKLTKFDSSKYYIVLGVSRKNKNYVQHYVALDYVDENSNEVYIVDPGSNNDPNLFNVYKVHEYRVYVKKD